ncbi:MAG: LysM domain-containing protein [bacterium]
MTKKAKESLSSEFKEEIKKSRSGLNGVFNVIIAILTIILIFGTVGMAAYQMLYKSTNVENKTVEEKIESRPKEEAVVATTTPVPTSTPVPVVATPEPTAEPVVSKSGEYTVAAGDVLGTIASKYNTTVAKLKELNSITDENSLQIGDIIKVP